MVAPARKPRRLLQPDETRRRIVAAARTLFTRRGFFNTSMPEICRAASLSTGAVYHHFAGKEAIAEAVYEETLAEVAALVDRIEAEHASTHDRCRALIAELFAWTEREPETMEYVLHVKHREVFPDSAPVCSARPFELFLDLVRTGIERGEIRAMDPHVAVASVTGGAIRLIHLRLDGVVRTPLPKFLEETWEAAWKGVGSRRGGNRPVGGRDRRNVRS